MSSRPAAIDLALPVHPAADHAEHAGAPAASRAESLQRTGRRAIVAGSVITIVGVVLYCMVCFAGGVNARVGDALLSDAVPFAGATLGILGLGTLVWLVGSLTYLRGAMEAGEEE